LGDRRVAARVDQPTNQLRLMGIAEIQAREVTVYDG
jgi:hypothetical protein